MTPSPAPRYRARSADLVKPEMFDLISTVGVLHI
jgi:hypothetical protein